MQDSFDPNKFLEDIQDGVRSSSSEMTARYQQIINAKWKSEDGLIPQIHCEINEELDPIVTISQEDGRNSDEIWRKVLEILAED